MFSSSSTIFLPNWSSWLVFKLMQKNTILSLSWNISLCEFRKLKMFRPNMSLETCYFSPPITFSNLQDTGNLHYDHWTHSHCFCCIHFPFILHLQNPQRLPYCIFKLPIGFRLFPLDLNFFNHFFFLADIEILSATMWMECEFSDLTGLSGFSWGPFQWESKFILW